VERWIPARLRNRKFFVGTQPRHCPAAERSQPARLQKLPGCRRSAFDNFDVPRLAALPAKRFEIFRWKSAKVNIDYHVEFDGHYYSVPHTPRTTVELRVTASLVECFIEQARGFATPPLSPAQGQTHHQARAHARLRTAPT
jgi:hypothetical protein